VILSVLTAFASELEKLAVATVRLPATNILKGGGTAVKGIRDIAKHTTAVPKAGQLPSLT